MRDYRDFLDPQVLTQVRDLSLRARLIVEGFLVGLHRSPYHGFSVEFKEHRLYTPGDDIRWIDWRALARTDRFFVKKYEEETNLKAYLILDISGSMDYPPSGLSKFEYARNLAAALAYLFFLQRDATGLLAFNGGVQVYMPPRASKAHLHDLLTQLAHLEPGGVTRPYRPLRVLAEQIRKKGMIILISDLLTDPEPIIKTLSYLQKRKHEVLVFHVLSPDEMDLKVAGPVVFKDLETGERIALNPGMLRRQYRKTVQQHMNHLKWAFRNRNIDYELFTTETPYDHALLYYLKRRERLA